MYIQRCRNCGEKELSMSETAIHNCGDDTSYEMKSKSIEVEASSLMLSRIREKLNEEDLISDDAYSFGNSLNYPIVVPFDTRKKGLIRKGQWSIDKEKIKQALSEIFTEKVGVKFSSDSLVDNRELREAKIYPSAKDRREFREIVKDKVEEDDDQ